MTASLASKVFIVTGGLGGIGRATARLLAEVEATVVVTDVIVDGAEAFIAELCSIGGRAEFLPADLVDEEQVAELVGTVMGRHGRLDGAFNNAGVTQTEIPLTELSSQSFDNIMRVNVLGTFNCLKYQMRALTDSGSIVLASSGLGAMAVPNRAAYIASKHALTGLARAAAVEGSIRGIRVNAVLPGSTRTEMAEAVYGALDHPDQLRAGALHLLKRLAEPEEIGRVVRWLLSEESSFVTGALVPVDGGATAGRRFS